MGEYRGDDFIGLHNWIQIYLQEKLGKIDYHGYFRRETVSFKEIKPSRNGVLLCQYIEVSLL